MSIDAHYVGGTRAMPDEVVHQDTELGTKAS